MRISDWIQTCALPIFASLVTAGLDTIALRCPAHPAMQDLIRESGRPLAAPSANASGSISPTRAEHVLAGLGGKISMILDAGPTERGLESTIVAPDEDHIRLLRPGPITAELDRKRDGLGKRVSVRVDTDGRHTINKTIHR